MTDVEWRDVGDLIERWSKRFPAELADNMAWVAEKKAELNDSTYAEGETGALRMGLSLHPLLVNYLESFHPQIFASNKNVKAFAEKFSKFSIPEKY